MQNVNKPMTYLGKDEKSIQSIPASQRCKFGFFQFVWRVDPTSRVKDIQVHVIQRHDMIDKNMQNKKIAPYMR